jgi:ATP-dependent DNA helicase RecG
VASNNASAPDNPLMRTVQFIKGVGPARAEQFRRLGIETVQDLLFHFPRAYQDLSDIRTIAQLSEGALQTVRGEVVEIEGKHLPDGRSIVSVVLSDGGKQCLEGIWFNQPHAARRFRFGLRVAFSGKATWFRDHWQMSNPRVSFLDNPASSLSAGSGDPRQAPEPTSLVVPVYPLTEDLRTDQLRPILRRLVDQYANLVPEVLTVELQQRHGFPGVSRALEDVHFPVTLAAAERARRRFLYEHFLVLQIALALRRREIRDRQRAPRLPVTPLINARIRRLLPFTLTGDQEKAVAGICKDLAGERPMQRLLQADVGAGKTAVAVYALLVTVANKHQAVLMAPTEVLAYQHWRTLEGYLAQSRVRRLLLTGALTPRERSAALAAIEAGEVDLIVGTQALVQNEVKFARLGLVVIDEQHKFGVNQRARVRRLGVDPHYLVMTATPIPRTVALTVFGDLDTTTIRELPPGRQPVVTRWVRENQRAWVYDQVCKELREGRQSYLVCPLVEESDTKELKSAEQTHAELSAGAFREFRVGLLHGRLDEDSKAKVMEQFRKRELDMLVSTVVIEVGVDVPNATVLIVEHAERFGLSQLHQLRGRISRGTVAGKCFLFAEPATEEARERLRIVTRTTDGFALAEHDARLRGVGEFFGTRQHGAGEVGVEQMIADKQLLQLARKDAFALVTADSGMRATEHAGLRRLVLERYGETLELAEIG